MSLNDINSLKEYLDELERYVDKTIIVAVKDNAGYWFDEELKHKLNNIGLEGNLIKKEMVGYVGIISNNKKIYEEVSKLGEDAYYSGCICDKHINVYSAPYFHNNTAIIEIDGSDYSINSRGLNIVVWNQEEHCIIDSVSFDTHVYDFRCTRKKPFDVGIFGWWYNLNYGAVLTYFALNRAIKKLGKTVLMLGRSDLENNLTGIQMDFAREHYDILLGKKYHELTQYNDLVKNFVLGSDQVWNPDLEKYTGDQFFFSFSKPTKRKIAYAQSFGNYSHVPDDFKNKYIKLVKSMDGISVREDYGISVLEEDFDYKTEQVCDPVFLLSPDDYNELIDEASINIDEPYILCFILDPTPEKIEVIRKAEDKLSKRIICLTDMEESEEKKDRFGRYKDCVINDISIQNFIKLYSGATHVITDSFHGTCFSIIFNKPFVSLANYRRGTGRFESLLRLFKLEDRLCLEYDKCNLDLLDECNFSEANGIYSTISEHGLNWLSNHLNNNHTEQLIKDRDKEKAIEIDVINENPEFRKLKILGDLLLDYGIVDIVLSPGGRDVPLVRMFENNEDKFNIHRVTDERSAAYFGLGLATQLHKPVACVCTSGTAVSNYVPAVTEAYYTGIPLVVITADRIAIFHNQGEDQTIQQYGVFTHEIKKQISVPEGKGFNAEYQARRDISECLLECTHDVPGPVHINFPITDISIGEKISDLAWEVKKGRRRLIKRCGLNDGEKSLYGWLDELKTSNRIMIVYGQNNPLDDEQKKYIDLFVKRFNCVVLTDHISNLNTGYTLKAYQSIINMSQERFDKEFTPDIVITVGGKRLMNDPITFKIRKGSNKIRHWNVSPDGRFRDVYFRLTSVLEMSQYMFFKWFAEHAEECSNNGEYYNLWKKENDRLAPVTVNAFNSNYIQSKFLPQIPNGSMLHLGVGMSFIESRKYRIADDVEVYCNMGTNGIDGCTSTFMGQCAVAKNDLCFLLVGDLSFFYDMNSIWNKNLSSRMRILMVNNNGSGLLRNNDLKAITSVHNTKARGWVESTGFKYISADNKKDFEENLLYFTSTETDEPIFFEVFCD